MSVNSEDIRTYLEGRSDEKYITSIESDYYSNVVTLVINSPTRGKHTRKDRYKPFFWFKLPDPNVLYNGDRGVLRKKMREYGIKIKELRTDGISRLEKGYKYIAHSSKGYRELNQFFKDGDYDPRENRDNFFKLSPTEQYLIQSGKRLFKGYEDYDDVHRFVFDIETTGLDVTRGEKIFAIGMKDNRGFEHVLEIESAEDERTAIECFFEIIDRLKPDIISGYNSENFDVPFILYRARKLGLDVDKITKTLKKNTPMKRSKATVKYGSETENYIKTEMFGYNITDVMHSVRKAMAINSSIKGWGLKYITKQSKANKPNRVYVAGDKIYKMWRDNLDYYFNDTNGDYFLVSELEKYQNKYDSELYEIVNGKYIIGRYLLDDLWETEKVDMKFNQATYLLAKIVPSSFLRTATMGVAKLWSILMGGWSYENGLAIPHLQEKRPFTGGLSRLLRVGFGRNIVKLDFSGLYPSEQLTHDIFPDVDISGVMKGMLSYIVNERYKYKDLKGKYKKEGNKELADLYDKKQLPLKILANSFFGSFGAPYIFPWGDIQMAEQITCTGRQYLRHMVKFFMKFDFGPTVLDTDGVNFIIPESVNNVKYIGKGKHRFVVEGKEYTGCEAVVAEYNDDYMFGMMGLDIDEICESTINISRKNYANLTDGEIKLVGNTIKSKKMAGFIEDFLDKGVMMLLKGDGKSFVELYYDQIEEIHAMRVPLGKIASKSKVKLTLEEYDHRCKHKKNVQGKPLPRQAHMELLTKGQIKKDLGSWVYYVNTGVKKNQSDISTKYYGNGDAKVTFSCKIVDENDLETTGYYNADRYINMFNKRIKPLLVCFKPEVRDTMQIYHPMQREYYTDRELELVSGMPYESGDQDTVEELFTVSPDEVAFWKRRGLSPNYMYDNISFEPKTMYAFDNISMELFEFSKLNGNKEEVLSRENIKVLIGEDLVNELL